MSRTECRRHRCDASTPSLSASAMLARILSRTLSPVMCFYERRVCHSSNALNAYGACRSVGRYLPVHAQGCLRFPRSAHSQASAVFARVQGQPPPQGVGSLPPANEMQTAPLAVPQF
eukprot:SAG11_NODE_2625_length_3164_cov_3.186623_4_plen_117_part_00